MTSISKKIILLGNFGVGKTSLVQQFVYQRFSEKYLTTLGVKIDKKIVSTTSAEVSMIIWDIAGEISMQQKNHNYYLGAHGVIYVVDLSRPSTYEQILIDLAIIREQLPMSKIVVVGNKADLLSDTQLQHLESFENLHCDFMTSARTGQNVEAMFEKMAYMLIG